MQNEPITEVMLEDTEALDYDDDVVDEVRDCLVLNGFDADEAAEFAYRAVHG